MEGLHVWQDHIHISRFDLVLARSSQVPLVANLGVLARIESVTRPAKTEIHVGDVQAFGWR